MCTYNGEKFLREQMDSILAQTYPLHEIIVCDDCSTDGTMDILQEYAARCPIVQVIRNSGNKGCNQNFHDALYLATGDYIAISDQDDIWFPQKIEMQVQTIGTGSYDICFSDTIASATYTTQLPADYKSLPFAAETLFFRNTVPGHTMLLRREFLVGLPDWNNMTFFYDWWLAMNAALEDSIVKCNMPLSWHRLHDQSVILTTGKSMMAIRDNKSAIAPYIWGISHYFKVRRLRSWRCFYGNIHDKTSPTRHPVLYEISGLFLTDSPTALFRQSYLCMKYRREIYPLPHTSQGLVFALRGFFAPFICFYYNYIARQLY